MIKKKGFTLVELLGVIIVLSVVMGIAVVAYIGINGKIDIAYYRGVEESLRMAGADYFYYNKGEAPKIFGDQKEVKALLLQENKYMQNGIVDKDGNSCNLTESKVIAYKDKTGTTQYHACLVCGEYKTSENDPVCRGEIGYYLSVRGTKEKSKESYKLDGSSWSGENIVLIFETANDVDKVYVGDTTTPLSKTDKGIVKSWTKTLTDNGEHTYKYYYTIEGSSEIVEGGEIKVKIDKTKPTLSLNPSTDQSIAITGDQIEEEIKINNVTDNESKIKTIEYSFEELKSGETDTKDKYQKLNLQGQDNNISLTVKKTLERKIYKLKVRAYNNAGLVSDIKEITYDIYRRVAKPTSSNYCNDLTYDGYSHQLAKTPSSDAGFYFDSSTNSGINASDYYVVKAHLKDGYRWSDDSKDDYEIRYCSIKQKEVSLSLSSYSGRASVGSSTGFTASVSPSIYGTFSNQVYSSTYASVSPQSDYAYGSLDVSVTGRNAGSTTVTVSFTPSDTTNYKVINNNRQYSITVTQPTYYYTISFIKRSTSGVETEVTSDRKTGYETAGTTVTGAPLPTYSGYKTPSVQNFTVSSSGSNNFKYYYEQEVVTPPTPTTYSYTISFIKRSTSGVETEVTSDRKTGSATAGTIVTGAPLPTYSGYKTPSVQNFTVSSSGSNNFKYYYEEIVPDVSYTVLYQRQNTKGGSTYTTYETVTGTGKVGDTVSPPVKDYSPNYKNPAQQSMVLTNSASSNVIQYKYEKLCDGTFCDYCDYGSPLGKCIYDNRNKIPGIWASNQPSLDSSHQNIRYTGTSPNNYVCFGGSSYSTCTEANNLHRIIGVYTTSHQVRLISTSQWSVNWADKIKLDYPESKLYTNMQKQATSIYGVRNSTGGFTWTSLILANPRKFIDVGGTRPELTRDTRTLWSSCTSEDFLDIELNGPDQITGIMYFPVSIADMILSTGKTGLKYNVDYATVKNSWLHIAVGGEWTYQKWNANYSYYIAKGGRLCGNTSSDADYYTKGCDDSTTGGPSYSHQYRINIDLSTSTLFCGGSATSSSPILVGSGSCKN